MGCSWGGTRLIVTRDLRTLIYLLNLELRENVREHCHWARRMGWNPVCSRGAAVEGDAIGRAAVEADAIGEQQSKRTRSGAAADRESGEQQLKRAQSGNSSWRRRQTGSSSGRMPQSCPRAAAEANASGEQQLKRTQSGRSSSSESCPAPDYAR